jgi:Fe-S-cluster containining protein
MGFPEARYRDTGCIRCGECCEAFLMDDDLLDRHRHDFCRGVLSEKHFPQIGQTLVLAAGGRCVFLQQDNTCSIYDDRPEFPCRIFGIPGWLECPAVGPGGAPRTREEHDEIIARNGDRSRWSAEFRRWLEERAAERVDALMKERGR